MLFCVVVAVLLCACSQSEWHYEGSAVPGQTLDQVNTGLPKIDLRTPGGVPIDNRHEWMEGATMTIYDADGHIDYQGSLSIRGRGNFTWEMPKKPYALKLVRKNTLLGMPAHKRWCLLANWLDRTLMRNDVAFEIARQMTALEYTPRGRFVEVFLNGQHQGNYYLCEQIKVDKNRVNISELSKNATTGVELTGGYLFELDNHFDEAFKFMSGRAQLPWQLKDPDEVNEAQLGYAHLYVAQLEDALYDETRFARRDFADIMDLESFADWWLVHELTMNTEPRHPRSCFMYKDKDTPEGQAKLKAGPVWDFDCWTFNPDVADCYAAFNTLYYVRLFQDEQFRQLVKKRWAALQQNRLTATVCNYIDQTERQLEASDRLNAPMWPVTYALNGDTFLSFHDAVQRLKDAFVKKSSWLDNAIERM